MYVSVIGQCSVSSWSLSTLFLESALQLGAHGFVYTGSREPPRPSHLPASSRAGIAASPSLSVGAQDCSQALPFAPQTFCHLSHLPWPYLCLHLACRFIMPGTSAATQFCCTHCAPVTAVLLLVLIINCSTQVQGVFSLHSDGATVC